MGYVFWMDYEKHYVYGLWFLSNVSDLPCLRDKSWYQNGWISGKLPKGGGGHFQSKSLNCRFWNFNQGWVFDHEIDAKESFQDMFFLTIVLRKSNQDKHWRGHFWPPPPYLEMFEKIILLVTPSIPKRTLEDNKRESISFIYTLPQLS